MIKQIHKPTWPFVKTVEVKQRIHVLYNITITAIQCSFSKVLILKHATSLNGIQFITEKKGTKKQIKFSTHLCLSFTLSNSIQFSFEFVFVFRSFLFFPFTHEQDEHVRPHRRADRIRPPPPSNLRIPTPPSFTPLVLSDLPTLFPLSVVPC